MSKYYFEYHDGEDVFSDDEGVELDGIEGAQERLAQGLLGLCERLVPERSEVNLSATARSEGEDILLGFVSFELKRLK